jgi:hypothetical protein
MIGERDGRRREGKNRDEGEEEGEEGKGAAWELHWWAIAVLTKIALALVHGITPLAISWPKNVWRRHWSGCVAINY